MFYMYSSRFIGRVARVNYESGEIVINRGSEHGIKVGERLHVVRLGDEIIDPDTNESLGQMESLVGRVQVIHVQENMSTAVSLDRFPRASSAPKSSMTATTTLNTLFESMRAAANQIAATPHSASSARELDQIQHSFAYSGLNASVGDLVVRV